MTMELGCKGRAETIVTSEKTAKTAGSGALDVFATPFMAALREGVDFIDTLKTASIVLAVLSWVEFQWLSLFWHRVKNFSLSMMARWWSQVPMTPVSS